MADFGSANEWLSCAEDLVPAALDKARAVRVFPGRWKSIVAKLEQIPPRLSDLSSHPCFSKNTLCKEQLQTVSKTLNESLELANKCLTGNYEGKLQMQSDLDALLGKLDLNLRDCRILINTGVLGEVSTSSELLARLQIGHLEAKHKALDALVEVMKEDEKTVLSLFGRSSISALVQLLTATSPTVREKTVTLICSLAESGSCENLLVAEEVLPPLIRLLESGSGVCREKSAIALQRLSASPETARSIAGHGGVAPLVEVCRTGDSASQASSACVLKNLSVIPDVRETLADDGAVEAMVELLDVGILPRSKDYAAEFLQNLTSTNDDLRTAVIAEGGVRSLLTYLDGPSPQEPAVGALRNLAPSVPAEALVPTLLHVLKSGSPGAQKTAASTICRISDSPETKKLVGESGCIPLLISLLEAKEGGVREVATQAAASLMTLSCNRREVKNDNRSVPSLVHLLDPSPQNTGKKYAVVCLGFLVTSKKCRKMMVSYGAIGYLKKLTEMDLPGSKKLLERLDGGKLTSLFGRK